MTLNEVYLKGKNILKKAKIYSYQFDAMKIFEFCFNFDRNNIILYKDINADKQKTLKFFKLIYQRKNGRPLQYILGCWPFMDAKIKVGEGVLIPRDDTEVLVNSTLLKLKNIKNPKILDLCAGPGTISISLAKKRPDANIIALEISSAALKYLYKNIIFNKVKNVTPIQFDLFYDLSNFNLKNFDLIVSNPPYIATKEIAKLQKEISYEPLIALDGGSDGLKFYRAIATKWCTILKKSGYLCVEIGYGQSAKILNIFEKANLKNFNVIKDLNGIERVIIANN